MEFNIGDCNFAFSMIAGASLGIEYVAPEAGMDPEEDDEGEYGHTLVVDIVLIRLLISWHT